MSVISFVIGYWGYWSSELRKLAVGLGRGIGVPVLVCMGPVWGVYVIRYGLHIARYTQACCARSVWSGTAVLVVKVLHSAGVTRCSDNNQFPYISLPQITVLCQIWPPKIKVEANVAGLVGTWVLQPAIWMQNVQRNHPTRWFVHKWLCLQATGGQTCNTFINLNYSEH